MMSRIHINEHAFVCTGIAVCFAIFGIGCTAEVQLAPDSGANRVLGVEFANFPVITTAQSSITWQEPYPKIQAHSAVVAAFPSAVDMDTLQLNNDAVTLNRADKLLEWDGVRTAGTQRVTITNNSGVEQYRFTLEVTPSQFLRDAFVAAAGSGATLEQWWVNENDPSYFYVGGKSSGDAARHYQMIFAHCVDNWTGNGDPDDDCARLKSRSLTGADMRVIRVPLAKENYAFVDTTTITAALVRERATLCAPPSAVVGRTADYNHPYVATRAQAIYDTLPYTASLLSSLNAKSERYMALNGSQQFLLLNKTQQRDCFEIAYLFEILPTTKPTPTNAQDPKKRTDFPPSPRYGKNSYELVYAEEFGSDTTLDTLIEDGYGLGFHYQHNYRQGNVRRWIPHSNFRSTPTKTDDPVFVKDGVLYFGAGMRPRDAANPADCSAPNNIFDARKCMLSTTAQALTTPFFYRYGLLEIGMLQAASPLYGMYMFLRSTLPPFSPWHYHYGQFAGSDFSPDRYTYQGEVVNGPGTHRRRPVIHNIETGDYNWESRYSGSEMELVEIFKVEGGIGDFVRSTGRILPRTTGASFWTVNHYGWSFRDNLPHWFYTINFDYSKPVRYAIEWTPEGYIVWFDKSDGNGYTKISSAKYTLYDNKKNLHVPSCNTGEVTSPHGAVPCGINHMPMQLQVSGGTGGGPHSGLVPHVSDDGIEKYNAVYQAHIQRYGLLDPDSRYLKFDFIRLYKPRNNYSDITPVYQ